MNTFVYMSNSENLTFKQIIDLTENFYDIPASIWNEVNDSNKHFIVIFVKSRFHSHREKTAEYSRVYVEFRSHNF